MILFRINNFHSKVAILGTVAEPFQNLSNHPPLQLQRPRFVEDYFILLGEAREHYSAWLFATGVRDALEAVASIIRFRPAALSFRFLTGAASSACTFFNSAQRFRFPP